MNSSEPLRVLFLASEADPFVKVGGLGDVAGSLPAALHSLSQDSASFAHNAGKPGFHGIDIRLAIPFHGAVYRTAKTIQPVAAFDIPHIDGPILAEVYQTQAWGIPVYLVGGSPFPTEAPVYTGNNEKDGFKYTFFSLACLELARFLEWRPHLLHANDWHTALSVYALSLLQGKDPFFAGTSTLLGIHNLPYLGVGAGPVLPGFGLPPADPSPLPWWARDLPLPLGLFAADGIVAVSPTYAREILTPQFGSGLDEFLKTREASITGILNGIDIARWDPATDGKLPANFSAEDLSPRALNKEALQRELGLDLEPHLPLMGMIARMDNQKGVDIALEALRLTADQPWQTVILGAGIPGLEEAARQLQAAFPERVRAVIRFDAHLSRQIYGAADALLIPSRYEPCGLTQMIAMRYGCVPIARATGGLLDTIYDNPTAEGSTGFLFSSPAPADLAAAIRRALAAYEDKLHWQKLQLNGMRQDFSWEKSAREYLQLYQSLVERKQTSGIFNA